MRLKIFIISIIVFLIISTNVSAINFKWDNLRINENEKLGKPDWWDRFSSGQIWIDWIYGTEKVSVKIWDISLQISGLSTGYQQVNIKILSTDVTDLENDFPDATVEYLYNDSGYSYLTLEMEMEDIAQRFWDELLHKRDTLADKSYIEKITLNQKMSLVHPMDTADYADEDDIARTTYDLCEDYGILDLKYSGDNISIAVLDTGVRNDNEGLNGTIIFNESFVTGETWKDLNGHGTHCIGIIAGQNTTVDKIQMRGVAPNATIYSFKVLDSNGRGSESDIVKGIMRAIELNVDIISMSLGGTIDYFSTLHDVIQYAVGKGIIIVAAAGNSASITSAQPASWEGVISVEALRENKHVALYTSLGGDIAAEGTNITSLDYKGVNSITTKSGTSMACPFVAGCIALLLEAQPSLRGKPTKVINYLKSTGNYVPEETQQIKLLRIIPATPDDYAYDTREVNPADLVTLTEISTITKNIIGDIRTQLLRNENV